MARCLAPPILEDAHAQPSMRDRFDADVQTEFTQRYISLSPPCPRGTPPWRSDTSLLASRRGGQRSLKLPVRYCASVPPLVGGQPVVGVGGCTSLATLLR